MGKNMEQLPASEKTSFESYHDDDSLNGSIHLMPGQKQSYQKRTFARFENFSGRSMILVNFLVLLLNLGLLFPNLWHWHTGTGSLNEDLKKVFLPSPLLDRLKMPMGERFSITQYGMGGPDRWVPEPNEDADKEWKRLTIEPILPIKESDIRAMHQDPEVIAKMPDEERYKVDGEQTYAAKAAVFHNIHCLYLMYKGVYHEYYYPNGTGNPLLNPWGKYHTQHCSRLLLDHLKCQPDPALYLYAYVDEPFHRPIPDSNVWRKCWDFESVLNQYENIAAWDIKETEFMKPAGQRAVPLPDGLMDMVEATGGLRWDDNCPDPEACGAETFY